MSSFILKDFNEICNQKRKYALLILVSSLLPLTYLWAGQGLINSAHLLMRFMFLCIPVMISIETTLNQTRESVKDGVFELLFINKLIKKERIVFSKCIINIIISCITAGISLILLLTVTAIMGKTFILKIDFAFILIFLLMCFVCTNIGFISSVFLNGKHGSILYTMFFLALLIFVFKIYEILNIYSSLYLLLILACLSTVSFIICKGMLNKNRFIVR